MSSIKNLYESINEVAGPKENSKDKEFIDKHPVAKIDDRNGNDEKHFKGGTKYSKRKKHRKGYDVGDDEKVYEDVDSLIEAAKKGYGPIHSRTYIVHNAGEGIGTSGGHKSLSKAMGVTASKHHIQQINHHKGGIQSFGKRFDWRGKALKEDTHLVGEEVNKENLQELSDKLKDRYVGGALDDIKVHQDGKKLASTFSKNSKDKKNHKDYADRKIQNRAAGIQRAIKEDELDEAASWQRDRGSLSGAVKKAEASRQRGIKRAAKMVKRGSSVEKAAREHDLFKSDHDKIRAMVDENVQIDELSNQKLGQYIKKASADKDKIAEPKVGLEKFAKKIKKNPMTVRSGGKNGVRYADLHRKHTNRTKGISTAVDKITKEELSQSDAELLEFTYNKLSSVNQQKFEETIQTEEGLNMMLDFAIKNRGNV